MHIRTFRAANLNAALAMIRQQMGPDAAVLHTRQVSTGVWRLVGSSRIEVTAGLRHSAAGRHDGHMPLDSEDPELAAAERRDEIDASTAGPKMLRRNRSADDTLVRHLCAAGLPPWIAERWVAESRDGISTSADNAHPPQPGTGPGDDLDRLRDALSHWLAARMRIAPPIRIVEGERRIAALVGSTGVGKTTTIAKLAARFRIDHRARVGLLTVDAFRAAAVEQLEAFARAMRAPMEVVRRSEDVPAALQRLGDVDLVLVDTVGQSPCGGARIDALRRLLASIEPDEILLVLEANKSMMAAGESLRAFSPFAPTSLVVSKMDEVRGGAPAMAAVLESGLGISYLTCGQMVPDDIALADAQSLAKWSSGLAADTPHSVISTPR